jgi:hypothetical protein
MIVLVAVDVKINQSQVFDGHLHDLGNKQTN